MHFLSLSFTPTAVIALNGNLEMPEFSFRVDAKPSLFAYPEAMKPKEEKKATKVKTAVLSITKKATQRAEKKKVRRCRVCAHSLTRRGLQ